MSLNSKYKNKKIFSIKHVEKLLETAKIDFERSKSISKQTQPHNINAN